MPDTSPSAMDRSGRARVIALAVILLAAFMDLMDVTILNVVLPSIEADLGAGPAALEWMLAGYTLALALGLISGARLGDLLGHKRVFLAGMAGFVAASALCGAAAGPGMLVGARVLQGLFAAAMIPQVLSQIQLLYPPAERGPAMAAFSALSGIAATIGPILGPALLEWNLWGSGWRLVFFVNVAVGVVALPAAWRSLPEARSQRAPRLDLLGAGISTVGLLAVLYPLITAASRSSWPGWASACLVAGLVVLAGFVAHQRRVEARGGDPLVRMSLLRIRSLAGGLLVQLLYLVPIMGFFLVFMQFLQNGLAMSPLQAGLTLLPWSVVVTVVAGLSAAVLLPKIGRAAVQIGLVVTAAGFVLLALVVVRASSSTGWVELLPGILVGAAGMGMVVSPIAVLTLGDLADSQAGTGSALFNTVSQLGASIGVAIIGTTFFTSVQHAGYQNLQHSAHSFGGAFADTLWLSIALLATALAASFLLPSPRDTTRQITAAAVRTRGHDPAPDRS